MLFCILTTFENIKNIFDDNFLINKHYCSDQVSNKISKLELHNFIKIIPTNLNLFKNDIFSYKNKELRNAIGHSNYYTDMELKEVIYYNLENKEYKINFIDLNILFIQLSLTYQFLSLFTLFLIKED